MIDIGEVMAAAPVIPVLVLDGSLDPAKLAATLVEAGLPVLEVTLRTPQALAAIRAMTEVPGAIVGAGTVLNEAQLDEAMEAGAQFIVAPGLTDRLTREAIKRGVAYLPGVATAGDIMRGLDHGLTSFKFFPAETSGGLEALKALSGPFGQVSFCPTGGITPQSAARWLSHPAVLCVGGSWIAPRGADDYSAIAAAARAAAELPRNGLAAGGRR